MKRMTAINNDGEAVYDVAARTASARPRLPEFAASRKPLTIAARPTKSGKASKNFNA